MQLLTEIRAQADRLSTLLGGVIESSDLASAMGSLDDEQVVAVLTSVSALVKAAEPVRIAAVGVAAQRSTRERGHAGLAQVRGHRTPVAFVQQITGSTRGDAAKHVRLGESLLAGVLAPVVDAATVPVPVPWHHVLGAALLAGRLTPAQHDAILRGLGEPPRAPATDAAGEDSEAVARDEAVIREAWEVAATQLIDEARDRTVEDLLRDARACRDLLDTAGAERRFAERYDARCFRMWVDENGIHRAHISFDDEGAAWMTTIIDSALRPRRGGPRFVDPAEAERARHLTEDPRTNDQLAYDLILDTLRAGALADAAAVFGARQPGVRVVVTRDSLTSDRDSFGRLGGGGFTEDGGLPLPGSTIDRMLCESGTVDCVVDDAGNPLDLGREQRLFSAKQRIALAVRDGGCRWGGCTTPASYCEAHHCDHWHQDQGRTDIDRGILLCRFHHLHLHNARWRITRERTGDFLLHSPPGMGAVPVILGSKSPLRFARILAPGARPRGAG